MRKPKFKFGHDANRSLMKKLVYNFFHYGKITTTNAKVKQLKRLIEKVVEKTKVENEANKNILLRYFHSEKLVKKVYQQVGKVFQKRQGGYVSINKLNERISDGVQMVRMQWVEPIVIDFNDEVKAVKIAKKTETEKVKKIEKK
ncbi:50S ribosomal protein L17 [Candidatus Roizmanbacteria bacterium CG_4_10_14_3_um_filter_33_21]|uniref:50S ribosomal protein L17 n=2 Tax=Candidatus Roizmaniibacteriota TaxID=1752723 RepID=A0A2M7E5Q0_9BACT|nr:50S ribosomal protein L17 [Candidatus Roizmanbacteria bacterium]PIV63054.1 MAG: 50S ribosomal protein L17 [Candidatus Roizmanbacteria bacterium CG01_land_8_20_14_3_00_33_9]PIX72334.1 MAG: 50S ribosomal protein L17 [Candidatus Roizmanbacteria bacterium CG_4_10_14_3_um_filter_33_21]